MVVRFLRAYGHGVRDYHDAFTGPDENRQDGPTAVEIESMIAKGIDQSAKNVAQSLAYIDADARLTFAPTQRRRAIGKNASASEKN